METVAAERFEFVAPFYCVVYLHCFFFIHANTRRLNKIGKNPNIMSQKEEHLINDPESTINSVVNALAIEASKEEPM